MEEKISKKATKRAVSTTKYVAKTDTSVIQKKPKKYINILSTKRNIRQIHNKTLINKIRKTKLKTSLKKVNSIINAPKIDDVEQLKNAFKNAQSRVMKSCAKNLIKKNKASRIVAKLNHKIKIKLQNIAK